MEIKKTLMMPKTNFEMRGNLANKEPKILEKWHKEQKIYEKMLERNRNNTPYIFHDGPPYANGNIHCGHMLNRLIKDFVLRYKNMKGYYTPFRFGWDTHGLPIEVQVTKSGVNRKTTPVIEFRNKCKEYALKQVENQKGQIYRLGVLGDFDDPYLTLDKEFEANQIEIFATMALKGLIYKGLKPVYWSYSSESALAEAEIEYKDVDSDAIYVSFDVKDGKNILSNDDSVIIWTTTPWTLPANLAICLNPNFKYGLYKTEKGNFLFLEDLQEQIVSEIGFEKCELIKEFKGKDLEGIICKHPFIDRDSLIILGDHVTNDAGTGCVHTAPGHGVDDFNVGVKYNLEPFCPVDYKGYMTKDAGKDVEGLFYLDANKKVIEILENNKHLLSRKTITHAYPHDWRTGKPVIFRATPQWFCSIKPIKDELLKSIDNVNWMPSWGKQRMHNMISDRNDWCISRQRLWGVPLPIIYNEDGSPIIDKDVFAHIVELVRKNGSNIWYELEVKELLPEGYKNEKSPNGKFKKETDIMDVWFDSGSSFNSVIKKAGFNIPCDLYLEGSDQYRGWFNSSLIISQACFNCPPYKNVVTHGFVMDENWDKMSKSKGNGIDPSKIANVYGSDILRFWAASVDYQQDVRISESIIKQVSEGYRKIRNTFKFLLGNLSNGEESKFTKEQLVDKYELIDLFILKKLEVLKNKVNDYYEKFNFQNALQDILTFMSTDLSSFYLDYAKDILYCDSKNSTRRLQIQSVIYQLVDTLMRLLNPIIPFTMDEVNLNFQNSLNVQLLDFPTKSNNYDDKLIDQYNLTLKLRSLVLKSIENLRRDNVIGSAQECEVYLLIKDEKLKELVKGFSNVELSRLFIVSKAEVVNKLDNISSSDEICDIYVKKAEGHKCDRCWNYSEDCIEVEGQHLCKRCFEVLNGK